MKFKYYIVQLDGEEVVGTDDPVVAGEFALSTTVIEAETGKVITDTSSVGAEIKEQTLYSF